MVLLLMTSVGELRLSRKHDFKGANEKKDGKHRQAQRVRTESGLRTCAGDEQKGLGFTETPECSSPLTKTVQLIVRTHTLTF